MPASQKSPGGKNTRVSSKAGLILPIIRVKKVLKEEHNLRQGRNASVFITGAAEAFLKHIIKNSIEHALQDGRKRLTSTHIDNAITQDGELRGYLTGVSFMNTYIKMHIPEYNKKTNKQLVKERKRKERAEKKQQKEEIETPEEVPKKKKEKKTKA